MFLENHRLNNAKIVSCDFLHIWEASETSTMTQRTLGGTRRKRKRTSGFRARMRTKNGQRVLKARRRKGRARLAVA